MIIFLADTTYIKQTQSQSLCAAKTLEKSPNTKIKYCLHAAGAAHFPLGPKALKTTTSVAAAATTTAAASGPKETPSAMCAA